MEKRRREPSAMRSTGAAGGARGLPDGGPAPPRPAPPRPAPGRRRSGSRERSFVRASGWLFGGALGVVRYDVFLYLDEHRSELRERGERRGGRRRVLARLARPLRALLLQRARHLVEIARDRGAHARGRGLAPERERARGGLEPGGRGGPSAAGGGRGGRGARPRRRRSGAAPASADAAPREEEGAGRIMIARAARRAREPRSARRGREPRRSLLSETRERPTPLSSSFQSLFIFSGFYFSNIASSTSR